MVCKGLPRYFIGRGKYQGYSACLNWVSIRCAKKDGEWLGSMTGPHTKEEWTSKLLGCAQRLWSLLEWRTSAECKRMWHVTPCSGKELRMLQERCSEGTSTLCWLSGIVFKIKSTSWRNVYKNLHCRITLSSKAVVSASKYLILFMNLLGNARYSPHFLLTLA
jgi:hypothetical protein